MNILEKELEEILFECLVSNPQELRDRGLYHKVNAIYLRQLELGSYGRADIVGFTIHPKDEYGQRQIDVSVFELKKEEVNQDTLHQACRYTKGIEEHLDNLGLKNYYLNLKMYLIGKKVEKGNWVYTMPFLENVSVYTYSIDLFKGMLFESHSGYSQNNPTFNSKKFKFSALRAYLKYSNELIGEKEVKLRNLPF